MALATLDELKAHINVTSSSSDAELIDKLDAAAEVVTRMIGQDFESGPVTERAQVHSGTVILRHRPVMGVSVADRAGAPVAGFHVNTDAGLLEDVTVRGPVTVTYSRSDGVVPASVREAVLVIAAHLFETQRMPGFQSADSLPAGFGGADGVPDTTLPGLGFAIPNRAMELLRSWIPKASAVA